MSMVSAAIAKKKIPRDAFITISLALYVLSCYLPTIPGTEIFGSLALYLFLGLSIYKLITKQTPIKIISYSIWYLAFGLIGVLSFYYAVDGAHVLSALYRLLVTLVLTFSFIQYVRDYSYLLRVLSFYSYLPIFIVTYLFVGGLLDTKGERLGQSTFGNANNLAMIMMITLCCIIFFILNGKKKFLLINIILSLVFLYVTALTGGRKFFLIPFVFLLLLLLLKYWHREKTKLGLYLLFFLLIVFASMWAIINIPVLYGQIGTRFEGLVSFLNGDVAYADASTVIRYMMIENGWNWFQQKPILGYGLNNFEVLFAGISPRTAYAHNNYIELMVNLGILGTLVYYTFYEYTIKELVKIRDDLTGLRNFFLAFILILLIFEMGAVTYSQYLNQTFLGLASVYVWLYKKNLLTLSK